MRTSDLKKKSASPARHQFESKGCDQQQHLDTLEQMLKLKCSFCGGGFAWFSCQTFLGFRIGPGSFFPLLDLFQLLLELDDRFMSLVEARSSCRDSSRRTFLPSTEAQAKVART